MSLKSLISTGTKVWLDGVEPDQIKSNRALGITGATSNPTIISQIIEKGNFDRRIVELIGQGLHGFADRMSSKTGLLFGPVARSR